MNQAEIKRKRTEALLKEVLPEALSMLDDTQLHNLIVTEVVCSKGRYDSKVYLDKSGIEEHEQAEILKKLRKVQGFLKNYVRESEGWFRSPNFTFEFDDHLEKIASIDKLFEQIKKEK